MARRKDGRPRSLPITVPPVVERWRCTKCKRTFLTPEKALAHANTPGHGTFSAA